MSKIKCNNLGCIVNKDGVCKANVQDCVIRIIPNEKEKLTTLPPPPLPPPVKTVTQNNNTINIRMDKIYTIVIVMLVFVAFLMGVYSGFVLKIALG